MKDNWEKVKLGEICTKIQYGYTESANKNPIGPKFLRITDIQNDFVDWKNVPYCKISDEDYQKYKLEIGDIVVARTGNTTGSNYTIKENVEAVFASYLIRYRINPKRANYQFVDFSLRSDLWKRFVKAIKGGSTQGGASADSFGSFPIQLPDLPTQRRIAAVLSCLDEKIALNNRINDNLEAMAKTVYEYWFVKILMRNGKGKLLRIYWFNILIPLYILMQKAFYKTVNIP